MSLDAYKDFLEKGTAEGQQWSLLPRVPLGRYFTFKKAFEMMRSQGVVVELGTTRSYVHGGLDGCNSSDDKYWRPDNPAAWDWGAGCFTRVAAECAPCGYLHTVDVSAEHIRRCRLMTRPLAFKIQYHCADSAQFLRDWDGAQSIDLLYMDTGDMTPIEPTAQQQLREAEVVVDRGLVLVGGLLLIDDVKNTTPLKFGEKSILGKSKYSIPYLLAHGFEIVMDEYQVLITRVK